MHDEATGKLKQSEPEPLSFDIDVVTDMHKEGVDALKLAKAYLDTAKQYVP